MKVKLSNGLYVDPCDPCILYDNPTEPTGETVVLTEEQKLRNEIDKLRSEITALTYKDTHFD